MYVFYECLISSMKLNVLLMTKKAELPGKGYIVVTESISDLAGVLWDTEMFVKLHKKFKH